MSVSAYVSRFKSDYSFWPVKAAGCREPPASVLLFICGERSPSAMSLGFNSICKHESIWALTFKCDCICINGLEMYASIYIVKINQVLFQSWTQFVLFYWLLEAFPLHCTSCNVVINLFSSIFGTCFSFHISQPIHSENARHLQYISCGYVENHTHNFQVLKCTHFLPVQFHITFHSISFHMF